MLYLLFVFSSLLLEFIIFYVFLPFGPFSYIFIFLLSTSRLLIYYYFTGFELCIKLFL
jgi:hypothetical protein